MTRKTRTPSIICLLLAGLFLFPAVLFAGQTQGRKEIVLYGGKSGNIRFPHHLHQSVVEDCQTCHIDFAQKEGALEAAKTSGTLKKKQIMDKTCLKCHRAMKKAGEKSGPTNCKDCHIK